MKKRTKKLSNSVEIFSIVIFLSECRALGDDVHCLFSCAILPRWLLQWCIPLQSVCWDYSALYIVVSVTVFIICPKKLGIVNCTVEEILSLNLSSFIMERLLRKVATGRFSMRPHHHQLLDSRFCDHTASSEFPFISSNITYRGTTTNRNLYPSAVGSVKRVGCFMPWLVTNHY